MKRLQLFFIGLMIGLLSVLVACVKIPEPMQASIEKQDQVAALEEEAASVENDFGQSAEYLEECGIVDLSEYSSDLYLTRIIAARMIADVTGLSASAAGTSYSHPFTDLSDESQVLVGYLYHLNILEGVDNNHYMENEVCDRQTFLMFLLRAIDSVGDASDTFVSRENALSISAERGIILSDDQEEVVSLSVNDAFDLCYNALFTAINDSGTTLYTYLLRSGVAARPTETVSADFSDAYEISWPSVTPFFTETFTGSKIDGPRIKNKNGTTVWYGGMARGVDNEITTDGYLLLSGRDQDLAENQEYALLKGFMAGNESYGMTFKVNVLSMANEGNEARAIFRVIPRTVDTSMTKYYAVNYYIVQQLGDYESNLIRCKWSITNTNAPSGTTPLAEAYFLLEVGVDYTGRLFIENTDDGNVHIAFYIDGPDRYTTSAEPLLEYTDTSPYKILESARGVALGISGHLNAEWGSAPAVKFDDIALYDAASFKLLNDRLEANIETPALLRETDGNASRLRYLINSGVIMPEQRSVDFEANVSVAQFLATAMYYTGEHMTLEQSLDTFVADTYFDIFKRTDEAKRTDFDRAITRYETALIIQKLLPGNPGNSKYRSLYTDTLDRDYDDAVYFAVQNSYLLLDSANRFNGTETISREELLNIFSCAADASLRDKNSVLTLPAIYSNNAVFQAGKTILIHGKGMSGDTITVWLGKLKQTTVVVDGEWSLEFESQKYGGPYVMRISDMAYTYSFRGIYVGEVIVVAGQSNAEMSIYESNNAREALSAFGYRDKIRVFQPSSQVATVTLSDTTTQWKTIEDQFSSYIIDATSAIGVFYVQELLKLDTTLKDVKFGIIQLTYGGTSIEMMTPETVFEEEGYVQRDDEFILSGFWNGYMNDVTPYSISTVLFYQGENSTQLGYIYEPMLRAYIEGIRGKFRDPDLPILLVQIAGYGDNYGQDNDVWPYIREVQMRVANTTENVGLVPSLDWSDANPQEIHPKDKQPIGQRLARLAMSLVYDQQGYGNQYIEMTSYEHDGNTYRLKFDTPDIKIDDTVNGDLAFEVMDAGGNWFKADAMIDGDTLVVWSDEVIVPYGARYAWSNYPKACLFGANGLPALPFNTTKDLFTPVYADAFTTDSHYLKKAYHLLYTGDVVVNLTRGNALRHVYVINAYMVEYTDGDIPSQAPGDRIALLKKQVDAIICDSGTTATLIVCANHGLKVGDWIYNTKYDAYAQVLEVVDENTVRVDSVPGQSDGNLCEVYRNIDTVIAQE